MTVSSVASSQYTNHAQKAAQASSAGGYTFSQIIAQMRTAQTAAVSASSAAAKRAAEVRAGLDAETLAHLDKYTEIYSKYAAQYGDGFEDKGLRINGCDEAAVAESMHYCDIRDAFRAELNKAGIPGELFLKRVTVDDLDSIDLSGLSQNIRVAEHSYVSTLFYAEKYGLAGLSKEEQCSAVMSGLTVNTPEDLCAAVSLLSKIGAISAQESFDIQRSVRLSSLPGQETGWSRLLDSIKDNENLKEVYALLSKAWAMQDDAEGAELEAILQKVDAQQEAIHEAIELSNKKRREHELLERAAAESARLRIMFGLDNNMAVEPAFMPQSTGWSIA